jgi:hypothetical protein
LGTTRSFFPEPPSLQRRQLTSLNIHGLIDQVLNDSLFFAFSCKLCTSYYKKENGKTKKEKGNQALGMYFSGEALAQHLRPWVPFLASG